MATLIDSLLIELGLDASKFTKSQKKVIDQLDQLEQKQSDVSKTTVNSNNAASSSFMSLAKGAAIFAAVAQGIKNLSADAFGLMRTNDALLQQATLLDTTTSKLNAMKQAVQGVTGATGEGMAASLQGISGDIAKAKLGMGVSDKLQTLARLGFSPLQWKGDQNDMVELSKRLETLSSNPNVGKQGAFQIASTLVDSGTAQFLLRGHDYVSQQFAQANKKGRVTDAEARQSQRALTTTNDVRMSKEGGEHTALQAELPAINAGLDATNRLADNLQKENDKTDGLISAILELTKQLKVVAVAVGGLMFLKALLPSASTAEKTGESIVKKVLKNGAKGALRFGKKALIDNPEIIGLWALFHSDSVNVGEDDYLKAHGIRTGLGKPTGKYKPVLTPMGKVDPTALFDGLEKKYNLPHGTLDSLITQESGRGKNMVSKAGATGYMQFMPATAKSMGLSRADTFDLGKSSDASAKYLSYLLRHYQGNLKNALDAYNWGVGNMDAFLKTGKGANGQDMKLETRNYAPQIMSRMNSASNSSRAKTDVQIDAININTQATDAKGISRDINKSLNSTLMVNFGVTGVV